MRASHLGSFVELAWLRPRSETREPRSHPIGRFRFHHTDSRKYRAVPCDRHLIHPPATKDVTSQATWAVDTGVISISGGVATTNGSCGTADVSATMPEGTGGASNIVIGYSTVTVNNPADPNCPGGGTEGTLSVEISPAGLGTVTSQTYGINCPTQSCIAVVPAGTSVALTAIPAASHLS